jgi:hypothetical protein
MHRIKISIKGQKDKIHFISPVNSGYYTLCGASHDEGIPEVGIFPGKITSNAVNCEACKEIVMACKQVLKHNMTKT